MKDLTSAAFFAVEWVDEDTLVAGGLATVKNETCLLLLQLQLDIDDREREAEGSPRRGEEEFDGENGGEIRSKFRIQVIHLDPQKSYCRSLAVYTERNTLESDPHPLLACGHQSGGLTVYRLFPRGSFFSHVTGLKERRRATGEDLREREHFYLPDDPDGKFGHFSFNRVMAVAFCEGVKVKQMGSAESRVGVRKSDGESVVQMRNRKGKGDKKFRTSRGVLSAECHESSAEVFLASFAQPSLRVARIPLDPEDAEESQKKLHDFVERRGGQGRDGENEGRDSCASVRTTDTAYFDRSQVHSSFHTERLYEKHEGFCSTAEWDQRGERLLSVSHDHGR
uniref:Uncharacterized protein n=1 Tax=Chromera velia CCMP2878 TaxID=1169474 RepID=A0A0G4I3G1_9ALVE|eukprot:Cvel_10613.t1-p1 / transcript=Cvel_10613.t1 / gene=Cvel_10613 / organism=Chromera_velia_CCMP2878 / gene_product=hypothetical protein / transcript_product=hypothetical protein / location=Cvel_scaffold644:32134-33144(-) / protein_length=337 / sequence_SO=supercontig / SO=protein_coding / is_pseudo=false